MHEGAILYFLVVFGVGLVLFLTYFVPSLMAWANRHPYSVGIFVLNLFLGWTFVGWVVCMVWAFCLPKDKAMVRYISLSPSGKGKE